MAEEPSDLNKKKAICSSALLETVAAVCDTFLPAIQLNGAHQADPSVVDFYLASASVAGVPQRVYEFLRGKVRHPMAPLARLGLMVMATSPGSLILCGWRSRLSLKFPYLMRFSEMTLEDREEVLRYWKNHWCCLFRILYTSMKLFTHLVHFTAVNEENDNVSWKAIGYSGPDPARNETTTGQKHGPPLKKGIINFDQPREAAIRQLENSGFTVSKTPNQKSLKSSFTINCDAVVVGSGSGGGLLAGVLAKAGHRVLVLEKGSYLARNNLSLREGEAMDEMYLSNGLLATNDMQVLLLAGSTVGGGSTINWAASIRTPDHVRKEWSEKHELGFFESKTYDHALDAVCGKMEVQEEVKDEGFQNMVLRKGCEKLGYPVENIPRNAPSDHYCGWCNFGCRDGRKKGTSETWLMDVVGSGNGAILPKCEAIEVITEKGKKGRRAVGVAFAFQNEDGDRETAVVEARVVVSAAGAISTPPLLKRSGLKNSNIGRNLHVHPVVMAWGYFPPTTGAWPEAEKKSYEGGIMTAMSKVAGNFEGSGYGAIIQTPSLHPGMFAALTPWLSGRDMKDRMLKFSRTAHVFALARDVGSGTVHSETNISYQPADIDRQHLTRGIEHVLRILAAAGAEEIGTQHGSGRVLNVKDAKEEELERFVKEESSRPLKNLSSPISSAHQMGSCRMGVDPRNSAVDPTGQTWEVEGLFVADTSVFPTALGVNPMVTVQAIAYCISQSVLDYLASK